MYWWVLPRLPPLETGAYLSEPMLTLWVPLSLRDFDLNLSQFHKSCLAPIAPMSPSSQDGEETLFCMDELAWQFLVGMQPVSHTVQRRSYENMRYGNGSKYTVRSCTCNGPGMAQAR